MRILDFSFRYALPALVFLAMAIGFAIGNSIAQLAFESSPWSFLYNVSFGLVGTGVCAFLLVKVSRVYFSKRFIESMKELGLTCNFVFEEAGNGIAIDANAGRVGISEQGSTSCIDLKSINQIESGWDQKNKLNSKVSNNILYIYTTSKEHSLIKISFGMNESKRNQAIHQLNAQISLENKNKE